MVRAVHRLRLYGERADRESMMNVAVNYPDLAWPALTDPQRTALEVRNPSTGAVIGLLPAATPDDVRNAIEAAEAALPLWAGVPAVERARILRDGARLVRERSHRIAGALVLENGKPLGEATAEIMAAADTFDWFAEEARRAYGRVIPPRSDATRLITLKEPVGVVAAFSPWNFPAVTSARKVAPALAAGCSVILKAAEETPATPMLIVQCLRDAGLPEGTLTQLYGDPGPISEQILRAKQIAKISFTGSTRVGRSLSRLAADGLKRITLELGGHAPLIVMDDVDPLLAARLAAVGKFRNAGQVCTSPTRFYVQSAIYDRFIDAIGEIAASLKVGDGFDPATQIGPLANERRVHAMEQLVADALARGSRLVTGGKRLGDKGNFFAPTVLADVPQDALIMQEEPFGPIVPISTFEQVEYAIVLANRTPFGLAGYAITDSRERAMRITAGLRCGLVGINNFTVAMPETPFGGVGDSGHGYEGGVEGLESYLVTKFVSEAV
jgi:succinate-semialdehyde dehydrogenase/glutarate-semialdehyde dehydrogenase